MADVAAIRVAIQGALSDVAGLRAFDIVQGQIATPCAFVRPLNHEEHDQDGDDVWTFRVELYVSMNSLRAAQPNLDAYLPGGTKDVKAAVEADNTLGGVVGSAACNFVDGSYDFKPNIREDAPILLGCEFDVEVYA